MRRTPGFTSSMYKGLSLGLFVQHTPGSLEPLVRFRLALADGRDPQLPVLAERSCEVKEHPSFGPSLIVQTLDCGNVEEVFDEQAAVRSRRPANRWLRRTAVRPAVSGRGRYRDRSGRRSSFGAASWDGSCPRAAGWFRWRSGSRSARPSGTQRNRLRDGRPPPWLAETSATCSASCWMIIR